MDPTTTFIQHMYLWCWNAVPGCMQQRHIEGGQLDTAKQSKATYMPESEGHTMRRSAQNRQTRAVARLIS